MNFGMITLNRNIKTKQNYVTDTDSLIIYIKTEDFYKDIANDVEKWFDTSNYDEDDGRPLPIGKNKKVIGLFNDELGGKIMIEFIELRAKTYVYLMNDNTEEKKAKRTKNCEIKRRLMFENYINFLLNNKIILQSQQRFKSDHHNIYTEQIHKIALRSNDDKRFQHLIKLQRIRMEQTHSKYAKVRC